MNVSYTPYPTGEKHTLHTISTFIDQNRIQLTRQRRKKFFSKLVFQCFAILVLQFDSANIPSIKRRIVLNQWMQRLLYSRAVLLHALYSHKRRLFGVLPNRVRRSQLDRQLQTFYLLFRISVTLPQSSFYWMWQNFILVQIIKIATTNIFQVYKSH